MADTPRAPIDVIAALHHPVRRRLVETLHLDGPATASRLADQTGEAVGNVSHHLKVLSTAGLVVEAPELARDRRERWWRAVPSSLSWSVEDAGDDPVGEVVLEAAERQVLDHHIGKARQWLAGRHEYDDSWRRAAFSSDSWVRVTPEELSELSERIVALIDEYVGPRRPDDGQERKNVFVFAHGMPARP